MLVTIPSTINGLPVTTIGDNAFLVQVQPDQHHHSRRRVTSTGGEAFADCTSLTNVTIPDSVTSIGNVALYGCTNLTAITVDSQNLGLQQCERSLV